MNDISKSRFADLPDSYQPPEWAAGAVWIMGAGPGDVGLLTLHALYGLQNADVVLHDSLVPPSVLKLAEHARLEYVGKRADGIEHKQEAIIARMIALAKEGSRVLRLKGGDPGIFGRGGEEAAALAQAGIPFRIFAGITSAQAAALAAGVILTHRDVNHAVALVTGHDADQVDWERLAKALPVLVIYMARAQGDIARRLLAAGRGIEESVVLISHASLPEQQIVRTNLGGLEEVRLPPPTIIIIGAHSWMDG